MAEAFVISLRDFERQIKKIEQEAKIDIKAAAVRAINKVSKKALSNQVKEVAKTLGEPQRKIREGVHATRATKNNASVIWTFTGYRFSMKNAGPILRKTAYKGREGSYKRSIGARYTTASGRRVTKKDRINRGSRAFVIVGQHSGKKIAVYRPEGSKRKVKTLQSSSRQYIVKHFSFPRARAEIRANLHAEVRNQMIRSKYIRRR